MKLRWLTILFFYVLTIPVLSQSVKYELNCSYELLYKKEQISKGFMGLREKTGNNDGYWIDRFNASVGNPKKASYCNAGQYFCWDSAKRVLKFMYQIPVPRSGLANSTFNYAAKKGKKVVVTPKKYDYIIWRMPNKINGHIETIDSVISRVKVRTKAYNTSFGSGTVQNGNGCGYKIRYLFHPMGLLQFRGLVGFRYGSAK